MRVKDIASAIEDFAPLAIQEDWDNSGLCIGSPEQEVHGVLLGFDCTPDLIDEAVSCGADMVVTHHPLIFNGLKKISPEDSVGLAVCKAISAGVAVYSAHTNSDKVLAGVSGAMAARLALEDVEVLERTEDGIGFGAIGNLGMQMSSHDFIEYAKVAFGLSVVRCSRPLEVPVRRVAVCGGSGASFIDLAASRGAQVYVCGDISYHRFFTGKDFMVMDIGHFEGEVEIVNILFSLIKKKFPNFAVRTSEKLESSNPVFYC
jgi:dinuclear metal center protein, YbgI/SA1388 family